MEVSVILCDEKQAFSWSTKLCNCPFLDAHPKNKDTIFVFFFQFHLSKVNPQIEKYIMRSLGDVSFSLLNDKRMKNKLFFAPTSIYL